MNREHKKKLEQKTRKLYETLYNDPLNQMQHYFPPWQNLGDIGRAWWVELVKEVQIDE